MKYGYRKATILDSLQSWEEIRNMKEMKCKCGKCDFISSEREHRDFIILKDDVLCALCYIQIKKDQQQLEKMRKKSKVPIV